MKKLLPFLLVLLPGLSFGLPYNSGGSSGGATSTGTVLTGSLADSVVFTNASKQLMTDVNLHYSLTDLPTAAYFSIGNPKIGYLNVISSNAVQAAYIDGTANTSSFFRYGLGVGNVITGAKLEVNGTGTSHAFTASTATAGSPIALGVNNAGNVIINGKLGIGTASPGRKLHIVGTDTEAVNIYGTGTGYEFLGYDAALGMARIGGFDTDHFVPLLVNTSSVTLDTGNLTLSSGRVSTAGGISIGGGATIAAATFGAASLDFGATAAGTCDTLTVTVTGAINGDAAFCGIPTALFTSDAYQSFQYSGTAANTVTVKRCNLTNAVTALSNPAAATVTCYVFR